MDSEIFVDLFAQFGDDIKIRKEVIRMVEKGLKVSIRPMEAEDINGILEVDKKISGKQRALTYRDHPSFINGHPSRRSLSRSFLHP